MLGFDHYADIAERLDDLIAGPLDRRAPARATAARCCRSRRCTARAAAADGRRARATRWLRPSGAAQAARRSAPVAALKLASGCDRRCTFCAIPSFRGSFVSRPPADVLAEARWLAEQGARELFLVSENSTSYGKDLGDLRPAPGDAAAASWPRSPASTGSGCPTCSRPRLAPGLLEAIATTPGVADYFDLSFQHSSEPVLRRMRRFGSTDAFLDLLERIRALAPDAGIRTNVIVGFPGETEDDLAELERFLVGARLDAVGVFGYSDEDGTEPPTCRTSSTRTSIAERVGRITALVEELTTQRAEDRVGTKVDVLVERLDADDDDCAGRAAHQAPEVDGECVLLDGSRRICSLASVTWSAARWSTPRAST